MTSREPVSQARHFFNAWTATSILLILIIIGGGIFIAVKHGRGKGVEISLESENLTIGQVYVGGEVESPGIYPRRAGDTIEGVLKAAGGPTDNADAGRLELNITSMGEATAPQKVDINRADAWLLADHFDKALLTLKGRQGSFAFWRGYCRNLPIYAETCQL